MIVVGVLDLPLHFIIIVIIIIIACLISYSDCRQCRHFFY